MTTANDRLRFSINKAIKVHKMESKSLMAKGSLAAARWEDGYVAALSWALSRLDGIRVRALAKRSAE